MDRKIEIEMKIVIAYLIGQKIILDVNVGRRHRVGGGDGEGCEEI